MSEHYDIEQELMDANAEIMELEAERDCLRIKLGMRGESISRMKVERDLVKEHLQQAITNIAKMKAERENAKAVAWMVVTEQGAYSIDWAYPNTEGWSIGRTPLYAAPPAQEADKKDAKPVAACPRCHGTGYWSETSGTGCASGICTCSAGVKFTLLQNTALPAQSARIAELEKDAARLRYLTSDIADFTKRRERNLILLRMSVMSYTAACVEIDAALKQEEGK